MSYKDEILITSICGLKKMGTTVQTARATMVVLRTQFPNNFISRFDNLLWSFWSSDLSTCHYFLCGYLKERAYKNKSRILIDLNQTIRQQITQITRDLLERVVTNFLQHADGNDHPKKNLIFRIWIIMKCNGINNEFLLQ